MARERELSNQMFPNIYIIFSFIFPFSRHRGVAEPLKWDVQSALFAVSLYFSFFLDDTATAAAATSRR